MEIPQYGEPEAQEARGAEAKPEVQQEAAIDMALSKSEMLQFIQEYNDKVAALEEQVDEAAEAEDYERAEELQEELDQY